MTDPLGPPRLLRHCPSRSRPPAKPSWPAPRPPAARLLLGAPTSTPAVVLPCLRCSPHKTNLRCNGSAKTLFSLDSEAHLPPPASPLAFPRQAGCNLWLTEVPMGSSLFPRDWRRRLLPTTPSRGASPSPCSWPLHHGHSFIYNLLWGNPESSGTSTLAG